MMLSKSQPWLFIVLICQGQKVFGNEIINGEIAKPGSLLYMASVQMNKQHKCGGFLVGEDYVLTAAHCEVLDTFPLHKSMDVVLGTHNIQKPDNTMRYEVTKTYKHPDYTNQLIHGNDIMLLKLSRKAIPSDTLQPIQLPSQVNIIKEKTDCLVAGWGRTKYHRQAVFELREANVSTMNYGMCKSQWQSKNVTLPPNVICAGGFNSDKGFCQGDSGGPLVCDGKVAGVVSFNYCTNCTYPNLPNVYTNISNYLPWINKIINEEE